MGGKSSVHVFVDDLPEIGHLLESQEARERALHLPAFLDRKEVTDEARLLEYPDMESSRSNA